MLLTLWPEVTNDLGQGTSGTVFNRAFYDLLKASIEDHLHSAANSTVKANDIIDEVVAARGNLASLDARLSTIVDDDGNPVAGSGSVTTAQGQSALGTVNLLANDTFIIWSGGDSAAPDYFALSGTGAAVARTGTGLADTKRKVGTFAAKLTYGSQAAKLTQVLLDSGVISSADILAGTTMGFGCWVWCATNGIARLTLDDGVASPTSTSYHTGDSTWQWLSTTHALRSNPTKLELQLRVEGAGSAYFSGAVVVMSDLAPSRWIPSPKAYGVLHFPIPGTLVTGAKKGVFLPSRPGIVKDVQIRLETAPTGDTVFDVNTWDGAAFTSMFSTNPKVVSGALVGGAQPDGTYARRCISAAYGGSTPGAGGMVSVDLDSLVGSPADAVVEVRVMQYLRPLEDFLAYND